MEGQYWKVFVPYDMLIADDGYIFGHVTFDNQSVYVVAFSTDVSLANQPPAGLALIGCWKYSSDKPQSPIPELYGEVSVCLAKNVHSEPRCMLHVKRKQQSCTCIVYNPSELLKSSILNERSEVEGSCDNITAVVKVLNKVRQDLSSYEMNGELQTYCGSSLRGPGLREKLVLWLLLAISWLYKPLMMFNTSQKKEEGQTQRFLAAPTVWTQLVTRAAHLKTVSSIQQQSPLDRLKSVNKCVIQVVDSLLGICLMLYLIKGGKSQYLADVSLSYGDTVAAEMKTLLHWLMGAPAGLKLNSQLTHFLANFFQYHIYLWTGYLYLLKPVLGHIVLYSSVTGVLGVTVQLALFQDIFTTLTLHIYCFYVYAARLYRLQVYALSSLWRLFRGKKWNVLRERVDSAQYDAGQLFVGTLLFTILLFLLPTTGLYYVVFTLLRLVILSIQGSVSKIRATLNKLPAWTVCLWLVQSASLTDAAVFHVLSPAPDKASALVVSLQGRRLGLAEAVSVTSHKMVKETALSWGAFVTNLLQGHLIYPWIERK